MTYLCQNCLTWRSERDEKCQDHNFCHNLLTQKVVSDGVKWWIYDSITHDLPREQVVAKVVVLTSNDLHAWPYIFG